MVHRFLSGGGSWGTPRPTWFGRRPTHRGRATSVVVVHVTMVVEVPKGSRNKYEMDHETGEIHLDRMLFTATRYPADYGFIPDTLADDDDPLDAMALVSEPTFPGCRIRIRPIGLFVMVDDGRDDHKVLGVPLGDPVWSEAHGLDDVPRHLLQELEHFFTVYKDLEDTKTDTKGWLPAEDVQPVLDRALAAYGS